MSVHFPKSNLNPRGRIARNLPPGICPPCAALLCEGLGFLGEGLPFIGLLQGQGCVWSQASFLPLQVSEGCRRSPAAEQTCPQPFPFCRTLHLTKNLRVGIIILLHFTDGKQAQGSKAACLTAHASSSDLQQEGIKSDQRKNCPTLVVQSPRTSC